MVSLLDILKKLWYQHSSETIVRHIADIDLQTQININKTEINNLKDADLILQNSMYNLNKITIIAGEDLPANRFINFSGKLCQAGQKVLGVTDREWLSGQASTIITHGIVLVETSGSITIIGSEVQPTTNGKVGSSMTPFQNIFCLDNATGAGSLIKVKL